MSAPNARASAPTIATFFSPDALVSGALVTLGEESAHHMRVRRLDAGDAIELRDGAGNGAPGRLVRLAKSHAVVELGTVVASPPPPAIHMLVPVADRDHMLWLAEKATELGAASWRPIVWKRSKSVGPRGEGAGFQSKVRARMIAALVQSEGAWLPEIHPDATLERALRALPECARVVLDPNGEPLASMPLSAPLAVAVGPEGGLEPAELDALDAAGFRRARLPGNILRFETAAIVGVALARARIDERTTSTPTEERRMAADCLFCRIVRGEIPAKLVAETEDCVAFRDIDPKAPTHVVIVPRTHVASLADTDDAALVGKLSLLAARIARDEGIAEGGYRTVVNTGPDAGQTIFHLHLHLLGGRHMAWPPG